MPGAEKESEGFSSWKRTNHCMQLSAHKKSAASTTIPLLSDIGHFLPQSKPTTLLTKPRYIIRGRHFCSARMASAIASSSACVFMPVSSLAYGLSPGFVAGRTCNHKQSVGNGLEIAHNGRFRRGLTDSIVAGKPHTSPLTAANAASPAVTTPPVVFPSFFACAISL